MQGNYQVRLTSSLSFRTPSRPLLSFDGSGEIARGGGQEPLCFSLFLSFSLVGMYQWRKFEFFEEKSGGKSSIPSEITGTIQCCSSGRGRIAVGCDDGTVSLIDRGFKLLYGFQAHPASVLFLQQLKQRNYLVTVGEEEQTSPQLSSICNAW